ncbi:unnamed protein product, partial [Iphiclides podalirius]
MERERGYPPVIKTKWCEGPSCSHDTVNATKHRKEVEFKTPPFNGDSDIRLPGNAKYRSSFGYSGDFCQKDTLTFAGYMGRQLP